jgi:hypothetical protein
MGCITSRGNWQPWPKRVGDVVDEIEVIVDTANGPVTVKKPIMTPRWLWPGMENGGGGNEKVDSDYMRNHASQAQENNIRAMEDRGD